MGEIKLPPGKIIRLIVGHEVRDAVGEAVEKLIASKEMGEEITKGMVGDTAFAILQNLGIIETKAETG